MADFTPVNRLVRKRNSNLQKQLNVTLHLLTEEYRQVKEQMYKDERDCGKFLQSLYSTVPGLQNYGQPNTRAMNTNAMLKERRCSVVMSGVNGEDGDDDEDENSTHFSHHRGNSIKSGRDTPVKGKGGGEGESGVGEAGGVVGGGRRRPHTAGPGVRHHSNGVNDSQRGQSPPRAGKRPATTTGAGRFSSGRFSYGKKGGAQYGVGACSEHERLMHDKVIGKFKFIFDPQTKAPSVNLSTIATPIVVLRGTAEDDDHYNSSHNGTEGDHPLQNKHSILLGTMSGVSNVKGRTGLSGRRVVWSAHPGRRTGVVSASDSARSERLSSDRPQASARPASSRPSVHSSFHCGKISKDSVIMASVLSSSFLSFESGKMSGRIDPKVQSLALQRKLPAPNIHRNDSASDTSDSTSDPEDDSLEDVGCSNAPPTLHSAAVTNGEANSQGRLRCVSASAHNRQLNTTHEPTEAMFTELNRQTAPNKSNLSQVKPSANVAHNKPSMNGTQCRPSQPSQNGTHSKHPPPSNQLSSSNLLQVPGTGPPQNALQNDGGKRESGHHAGHSHAHGPPAYKGWSVVRNLIKRPSSKLSETKSHDSCMSQPPTQLMARLMAAGTTPSSSAKAKSPAPSKSQLIHRSMPAPRQTVVGILAQIENQKANTRAMLDTSRQLQKVVKKLVPWEQPPKEDDYDDW